MTEPRRPTVALKVAWVVWLVALIVIVLGAAFASAPIIGLGFLIVLFGAVPFGIWDASRAHITVQPTVKTTSKKVRFEVPDE